MSDKHEFKVGDRCRTKNGDTLLTILALHNGLAWVTQEGGYHGTRMLGDLTPLPPSPSWPERVELVLHAGGLVQVAGEQRFNTEVARRTIDLTGPSYRELIHAGYSFGTHPWQGVCWLTPDPIFFKADSHEAAFAAAAEHYEKRNATTPTPGVPT